VADACVKFVKILRAEIEDLLEDVAVAERRHAARFARRELTDYVFKQNEALFKAEEESFRRVLQSLGSVDAARYRDLDELAAAVDTLVREVVRDHEEPEAIYRFVSRKLKKVRAYVESCDEPPS